MWQVIPPSHLCDEGVLHYWDYKVLEVLIYLLSPTLGRIHYFYNIAVKESVYLPSITSEV